MDSKCRKFLPKRRSTVFTKVFRKFYETNFNTARSSKKPTFSSSNKSKNSTPCQKLATKQIEEMISPPNSQPRCQHIYLHFRIMLNMLIKALKKSTFSEMNFENLLNSTIFPFLLIAANSNFTCVYKCYLTTIVMQRRFCFANLCCVVNPLNLAHPGIKCPTTLFRP